MCGGCACSDPLWVVYPPPGEGVGGSYCDFSVWTDTFCCNPTPSPASAIPGKCILCTGRGSCIAGAGLSPTPSTSDIFYVRHLHRGGVLLFHKSCDNSCEQAQIPPTQMHSYTNLKRQEIVLGPANCHRLRFESVCGGDHRHRQPTTTDTRPECVGWLVVPRHRQLSGQS